MIYTSYFANIPKIPKKIKKLSIARITPSWAEVDGEVKELAPSSDLLNRYKDGLINEAIYITEYEAQLRELDPFEIADKIEGKAIMCYEKVGDFCHRNLVAKWLESFGFKIKELATTKELADIKVEYTSTLNTNECENNPDKIYVYGDNLISEGEVGQAVIRNCKNSFGIPTKRIPSMLEEGFFSDMKDEEEAVLKSLRELYKIATTGKIIVFPIMGVGTGLAKMEEKSPKIYKQMKTIIDKFFLSHVEKQNKSLFD